MLHWSTMWLKPTSLSKREASGSGVHAPDLLQINWVNRNRHES